jgi:Domain of unknown function (DUF3597)
MRNKSEEQTMSIFGKIMSSIFGKASASGVTPTATDAKTSSTATATAPTGQAGEVDVAGILTQLATEKKEKLDWRKSIVDLMKLLRSRQQSIGAQRASTGTALLRRHERLGIDECLAAQAGHAEARRKWRQGAGGAEGLKTA